MNLFVLRALNFSRRWKDELFPLLSFFSAQFVHSLHRCCFSPSFDFFSLLHCLLVFTTWLEPPVGVRDFHRVNFLFLCCYFVALFHRSFESSCVRLAEKCIKTATSTPSFALSPSREWIFTAKKCVYEHGGKNPAHCEEEKLSYKEKKDERRMGWMERSTAVRRKRFATWGGATTKVEQTDNVIILNWQQNIFMLLARTSCWCWDAFRCREWSRSWALRITNL